MKEVALIIGANVFLFVWGCWRYQKLDHERSREKFMVMVRNWDVALRESAAFAGVAFRTTRWGFWLECEATWITPSGEKLRGKATL